MKKTEAASSSSLTTGKWDYRKEDSPCSLWSQDVKFGQTGEQFPRHTQGVKEHAALKVFQVESMHMCVCVYMCVSKADLGKRHIINTHDELLIK